MKVSTILASLLVILGSPVFLAGQNVLSFRLLDPPSEATAGDEMMIMLRADIEPGWHLYSMDLPPGGPISTTIRVVENAAFVSGGAPVEPEPIPWFDPNFNMQTNYHEDVADFQVPVRVKPDAPDGFASLELTIRFMACDDRSCLPPQTRSVSAEVMVTGGGPAAPGLAEVPPEPAVEPASVEDAGTGLPAGTLAYIWFSMTMGALALLTPCVYPLIPITVSYFTKREAQTRSRAVIDAALYSLGIIATFSLLGFSLTFLLGAGGISQLASSPGVNLLIFTIFVVFALSLFGVLELRVPNSWLNAVNRKSSQTGGVLGIFLMALTFSLTSFTCTVPFVGTVMVAALQGDVLWAMLGVTAFATIFAFPFFLLAIFPSMLKSLPKSGNWMNAMKITMGFLILAVAFKFLSNVDAVYQWELLTRPVVIALWLAIGLVTAVYLLGWIRFPHESVSDSVGTARVLFAILFLAVSLYLFRGLFGFGLGELDAFLPSRHYGTVASVGFAPDSGRVAAKDEWFSNYEQGLRAAQSEGRPLFVDFTGYTCTNCRWMEANMFPDPEVQALFREYVLVKLYTDGPRPEHEENRRLKQERFATIALPYYALISPDDETIATFPGMTRDRSEFIEFLEKGVRWREAEASVADLTRGG
jgi:thiol:disulfide interchange protein